MSRDSDSRRRDQRRDLYVSFEIGPSPESGCPFGEFGGDVEEIRQQLVNDECHTDTTVHVEECDCSPESECTEVVHTSTAVEPSCPCAIFGSFGCVPKLTNVSDGRIVIETYLPDRDRLADLVDALKEVTEDLRLRQLKRIDTGEANRSEHVVTLDLYEVTEKQREAVAKAVAAGYYSSPREASLEDLASDLGVTKSAVSQRLNAVESKLATAAFEAIGAD